MDEIRRSSHQTLNSSGFDAKHIDEVIASIKSNEKLKDVSVTPDPNNSENYQLTFREIHIADIAKMGSRYLLWIDPALKEQEAYEITIAPVCDRLAELLLAYASKEVQEYVRRQKPTQESSL